MVTPENCDAPETLGVPASFTSGNSLGNQRSKALILLIGIIVPKEGKLSPSQLSI